MQEREDAPKPGAIQDLAVCAEDARRGDRYAMNTLMQAYRDDIYRMVYYRTRSQMDAEDLTQEIFLKAFNNLTSLKDTATFRSWLYRIAVNRVRDYHRKRKFMALFITVSDDEDSPHLDDMGHTPADALNQVMSKEFWQEVGVFMKQLSRLEREVFQLRFMDRLGIAEISQILKRNESSVKTHLYRAINKFKGQDRLLELVKGATV
jgi:RNA polymerase sigma-70 factor (ECF subfamily)